MKNTLLHCVSSVRQTSFKFLTRSITLLMLLALGSSSLWAADGDTHDFAQTLSQQLNDNAPISSISIPQQEYAVKGIVVSYKTNKAASKVNIACSVGSDNWGNKDITSNTTTTMSFSGTAKKGAITLSFTNKSGTGSGKGTFTVTNVQLVEGGSAAKINVTLSRNGVTEIKSNQASPYTLPAAASEADACTDWKFKGWSTSPVTSTTTEPSYVTSVSSTTTVYAVYGKTEGSSTPTTTTYTLNGNWTTDNGNWTKLSGNLSSSLATDKYGINSGSTSASSPQSYTGITTVKFTGTKSKSGDGDVEVWYKSGSSWTSLGSKTFGTSLTWSPSTPVSGELKIQMTQSAGNIYIASIAVTYSDATTTYTTSPECKTLSSIAVTTPPTKTTYTEGETFDPAGMVVTATYTDHTTAPITGYTYSPTGALAVGTTSITISYGGKTTTQPITVNAIPTRTINWLVNNSSVKSESKKEGVKLKTLTMPPTPADDALPCSDKFMGWSRSNLGAALGQDAPTDLFTDITKFPDSEVVGSSDITFYAVFASSTSAGAGTSKIWDVDDIVSGGDYYIGGTVSSKDYFLKQRPSDAAEAYKNGSTNEKGEAEILTFTKSGGNWTIKVGSKYVALNSTNASLTYQTSSATFEISGDDGLYLENNSRQFTLNASSLNNFGSYATTFTGGADIWLLPAAGYEDYVTSCGKSLSISPKSLTATRPNSGTGTLLATANLYTPTGYTWTSDNESVATVSGSGATATVTYHASGSCTITCSAPDGSNPMTATATVTVPQGYYVEYIDGGSSTYVRDLIPGDKYTLPTGSMGCEGYTFLGWVTSSFSDGTTTKPSPILSGQKTMLAENVTYYAVYSKTESEGGVASLVKLGGTHGFTAGEELVIVATGEGWAKLMYQETISTSYVKSENFDNNVATIAANELRSWTLSNGSTSGKWYLGDDAKGYLNNSSNNLYCDGDKSELTISWDNTESKFRIKMSSDYYLSCRSDLTGDNQYKYRGGGTAGTNGTTYFDIYKYQPGGGTTTTYTNSPECCELKPVTNVQVSDLTATGCKISWTKPSPITGITKLQIINADNDEVVKDNIDANATSATLSGLTECQTYSFKVASVGSECTTYSGSVSAMPYGGAITVTFDYNGGTGEILSASTDCEHTSILLPEPETRSHAIFDGWFTQRQDGTLVGQAGDPYTPTASCTLYAHWTKDPGAEIMTWYEDGIDVMVNVGGSPSVLLMDEKTYGTEGGQNANDLFISKYFEATGNLKLLGIYNGTDSDIDVSDVVISVAIGHLNSSGGNSNPDYRYFGADPSGQNGFWLKNVIPSKVIHSGEEIILYTFNTSESTETSDGTLKECIEGTLNALFEDDLGLERENWYNVEPTTASNGYLNWSGSQSIMLAHSDGDKLTPIDIFGGYSIDYGEYKTSSESGAVLQYTKGKSSFNVMKHDGTTAIDTYDGDGPSYLAYGQNYNDQEGPDIVIGTNRILLIRKNTVVDGSNALDKNYDKGFMTLGEEWMGAPVGGGSGTDAADNVCTNFSAVAQYDYSMYYKTFETIMEQTQLDEFDLNDDGTYFIPIDRLDTLSCSRMKLQVYANSTDKKPVAESMYYVPIFVSDANHSTNETLFTKYTHNVCKTCNVVVSNGHTLTVASSAAGGIDTIGNIYVYENSKFVAENQLAANSISFRSRQDEVASGDLLNNNILVGHKKNTQTKVYFTKFISDDDWHWITVPYAVNIDEVTFSDSSECVYGQDWYLKYYDGEARADNPKQADGRNWKLVDKNTTPQLLPGVGYIVAINDQPSTTLNSKTVHKWRELSFPMAGYDETNDKYVSTYAYGAGSGYADLTPNNKGWNLVGNPYISYYKNAHPGTPLQTGKLNPIDDGAGGTTYENSGDGLYYVTVPNAAGRAGYTQALISATILPPFTSYFVQIAGTTKNQEKVVNFLAADREAAASAPLRRNVALEEEEVELPTFVGVNLFNSLGEVDNTGLCILDAYTQSTYEVGADLGKWIGSKYSSYTQPILYSTAHSDKLAFNALSEEEAKQNMAVSLGCVLLQSGTYTFSLNRDYDLSRVESVFLYDALTNTNTDLTKSDYTFSGSAANKEINDRFYLSAVLREKVDVVTGLGMKTFGDDAIIKFITPDGQLHVARKGVVYDAQGRIERVIR